MLESYSEPDEKTSVNILGNGESAAAAGHNLPRVQRLSVALTSHTLGEPLADPFRWDSFAEQMRMHV